MTTITQNVTTTKEFKFEPTELEITILELTNEKKSVRVQTVLKQRLERGTIEQKEVIEMPTSAMEAVFDGYDAINQSPTINIKALEVILSQFNLTLAK